MFSFVLPGEAVAVNIAGLISCLPCQVPAAGFLCGLPLIVLVISDLMLCQAAPGQSVCRYRNEMIMAPSKFHSPGENESPRSDHAFAGVAPSLLEVAMTERRASVVGPDYCSQRVREAPSAGRGVGAAVSAVYDGLSCWRQAL